MILALLLQATVPTLDALPQQTLPDKGCAAYLWSVADRRFVAMATADPATLRIALDGKVVDVTWARQTGIGDYGFPAIGTYAAGDLSVTLEMTIVRRGDLSAGAGVPSGTLTIERAERDSVIVPVAGLIGCS